MVGISKDPVGRMSEIMDVAERLFSEQGYEETSVSDIERAVGISQGAFYFHFPAKEDVLEAIVKRHLMTMYVDIERVALAASPAKQRLEHIAFRLLHYLREGDKPLFVSIFASNPYQAAEVYVRLAGEMYQPFFIKLLLDGSREGVFNVPYVEETLEFIIAVLQCVCRSFFVDQPGDRLTYRMKIASRMIGSALGLEGERLGLQA